MVRRLISGGQHDEAPDSRGLEMYGAISQTFRSLCYPASIKDSYTNICLAHPESPLLWPGYYSLFQLMTSRGETLSRIGWRCTQCIAYKAIRRTELPIRSQNIQANEELSPPNH
eukprot:845814-Amphidinium_carterae.1